MNGFWLIAHRYILLLGGQTKWFMLKSMLLFHQRTYQQHALPDNLIPVHFKWCFFLYTLVRIKYMVADIRLGRQFKRIGSSLKSLNLSEVEISGWARSLGSVSISSIYCHLFPLPSSHITCNVSQTCQPKYIDPLTTTL